MSVLDRPRPPGTASRRPPRCHPCRRTPALAVVWLVVLGNLALIQVVLLARISLLARAVGSTG